MSVQETEARTDVLAAETRERRQRVELEEAAKYRRVDCLRIAQKYLEHLGRGSDSLIRTAANIAQFVETGDTGEPAKQAT